jgi:3,4-dihydroxyphenylacetate 2,3-dioxygenase
VKNYACRRKLRSVKMKTLSHFISGIPQTGISGRYGDIFDPNTGEGVGKAIAASDRRVLLIASGAMSHRFWPLSQLHLHEASNPIHISRPEARAADYERLDWFAAGQHAKVIYTMPDYLKHVPEARFGHYLLMAGACGGRDCTWTSERYSDYENATGTS